MDRMDVLRDRLTKLRTIFKNTGLGLKRLADAADVSLATLNNLKTIKSATCVKIVSGAAAALKLDSAQLLAWACGEMDPSLEQHLEALLDLRECRTEGCGWYPRQMMIERLRLCRRCARLEKTPEIAHWEAEVQRRLPGVNDAIILRGWTEVRKDPMAAMKHSAMAAAVGLSAVEWLKRWQAANLPQKRYSPSRRTNIWPRAR